MSRLLSGVRDAISKLDPTEVRKLADREVTIEVHASHPEVYREVESLLAPPTLSSRRTARVRQTVFRAGELDREPDLLIEEEGFHQHRDSFLYRSGEPQLMIREVLDRRHDLKLALARQYKPFRDAVVSSTIYQVSKENALFSVATALPSVVPFLSLPWAVGEFASDTAFLTANQIRMAFLLAGASDRVVGYKEQSTEIASMVAGAFGWRAIARELVGKIPLGGGLIPKAAVAFAGTFVVGMSLDRLYRVGYGYTREERRTVYGEAFERGKAVVGAFMEAYRKG